MFRLIKVLRNRQLWLAAIAGAVTMAALPPITLAQSKYPTRPVRVIVPFPPAGAVDVVARPLVQKLSERLGQQFYIENIPGAGGNIGTGQAAKATPDGYTILMAFSSYVVNPTLFDKLPYDPYKDFEAVTLAATTPTALIVNPSVPSKTLKELVDVIRASPGKYSFAHAGLGTQGHLTGEQLRRNLGLDLVPVPFNGGGPTVVSVLGGHTPVGFVALGPALPNIKDGKLHALAVTGKARSPVLPDVPTMAEAGQPGIMGDNWVGVLVPTGTPAEIISLLNREFVQALRDTEMTRRLLALGYEPVASTPGEFSEIIKAEFGIWRNVIQAAHIKMH